MEIKIRGPKLILKFPNPIPNPKQLKSAAFHSTRTNLKSVKPSCSKDTTTTAVAAGVQDTEAFLAAATSGVAYEAA